MCLDSVTQMVGTGNCDCQAKNQEDEGDPGRERAAEATRHGALAG